LVWLSSSPSSLLVELLFRDCPFSGLPRNDVSLALRFTLPSLPIEVFPGLFDGRADTWCPFTSAPAASGPPLWPLWRQIKHMGIAGSKLSMGNDWRWKSRFVATAARTSSAGSARPRRPLFDKTHSGKRGTSRCCHYFCQCGMLTADLLWLEFQSVVCCLLDLTYE